MKKILLIDDDKFLIRMYGSKIKALGYDVTRLENGSKALETAKKIKPDLILLDLIMPIKDGFDTLQDLKSDKTTKSIPVVVASNLQSKGGRGGGAGKSIYIISLSKMWYNINSWKQNFTPLFFNFLV